MLQDIIAYNNALAENDKAICNQLYIAIIDALPKAESKVWHGHPVWFLDGNPIVGYSKAKNKVRLLFWSGQSFDEPGLKPEGKFKAAEVVYTSITEIDKKQLKRWLTQSKKIQWDYKNLVKRKGVLERLS